VALTDVMLAANDELLVVTEDCNPSIRVAADELLVTMVEDSDTMLALSDAESVKNAEFSAVKLDANEELVVVREP